MISTCSIPDLLIDRKEPIKSFKRRGGRIRNDDFLDEESPKGHKKSIYNKNSIRYKRRQSQKRF